MTIFWFIAFGENEAVSCKWVVKCMRGYNEQEVSVTELGLLLNLPRLRSGPVKFSTSRHKPWLKLAGP